MAVLLGITSVKTTIARYDMCGIGKFIIASIASIVLVFSLIALAQAKSEFMLIPAFIIIGWMLTSVSMLDAMDNK